MMCFGEHHDILEEDSDMNIVTERINFCLLCGNKAYLTGSPLDVFICDNCLYNIEGMSALSLEYALVTIASRLSNKISDKNGHNDCEIYFAMLSSALKTLVLKGVLEDFKLVLGSTRNTFFWIEYITKRFLPPPTCSTRVSPFREPVPGRTSPMEIQEFCNVRQLNSFAPKDRNKMNIPEELFEIN